MTHFIVLGFAGLTAVHVPCANAEPGRGAMPDTAPADTSGLSESTPRRLEWYSMFANIPRDWERYPQVAFRTNTVPAIIGLTALTGVLIVTDEDTWRMSDRWYRSSPVVKSASNFFEYLGDGRPQFGLAAGFALYGFAANDQRALRTASQTVEVILACGTVVQVLKHITGRQSPFLSTRTGGRWDFFPNQIEYHKHVPAYDAFPSGHIATALATVTVVVENYPEWTWARPVGYTIVGLIGISMANTGIHWYSDYPLGLILGYMFGMLASHPEGWMSDVGARASRGLLSVSPLLTDRAVGFRMAFSL